MGEEDRTNLVEDLAITNHGLRTSSIELISGEERAAFEAITGHCPHPTVFLHHVPHTVSTNVESPRFQQLTSLHEFEKTTGGADLVLDQGVVKVSGSDVLAWHTYSTVYVPAFVGQGITTTGYGLKIADPIAFYNLNDFFRLDTPSCVNLWVKKTGTRAVWVYP